MNLKRAFLILIAAMLLPGLAMAQQTVRFAVEKEFADDNPGSIEVTLTCNTGLPLTQSKDITAIDGVMFVVEEMPFVDGDLVDGAECVITEDGEVGYTGLYTANLGLDGEDISANGCMYDAGGLIDNLLPDLNTCHILNTPALVPVNVTKEWVTAGAGDEVTYLASVEVRSFNPIRDDLGNDGLECLDDELGSPSGEIDIEYCIDLEFVGPSTQTRTAWVMPDWSGTTVWLDEDITDNSIDSSNTCGGLNASVRVFPGEGAGCTFINTVFFEGIPTLNQYGLAILALLMLGVGMVGFRRFS